MFKWLARKLWRACLEEKSDANTKWWVNEKLEVHRVCSLHYNGKEFERAVMDTEIVRKLIRELNYEIVFHTGKFELRKKPDYTQVLKPKKGK